VTAAAANCYCGAVHASLDLSDAGALHCHCSQCRRLSGAAFSTWLNLPKAGFRIEAGADDVTAFAVSANATRHFCRHCGAHVYSTDGREPDIVGLPLGVVTGDNLPQPGTHYYFDSGVAWCDVAMTARKAGGPTGLEPLD
jgi:hypothetical protein